MRVILDTNILCSALLTPGGPTDQLYRAWRDKRFVLLTSEEQLEEFRRITRYPRVKAFIEPAASGTMHNELRHVAVVLERLPAVEQSQDPADNFLLAMAESGNADFLVTGVKHGLLSLGTFRSTRIVTARQMLERLGEKKKRPRRLPGRAARRARRK